MQGRLFLVFTIATFLLLVLGFAVFQAGLARAQETPPPTQAPDPSISVSPSQGSPETSVTVSGENFSPNQTVQITFDGSSVGSVSTGDGSWSQSFSVPSSPSGTYTIEAGGVTSTFTVVPEASLSSTSGSVGSQVTASGEGFGASEEITISFGDEDVASATADSNGSFSTSFDVPPIAAGSYTVSIGNASSVSFTVSSSFTVSPSSGPPGTSVRVRGSGFEPNSSVDLTIDGDPIQSVTTGSDGALSASVQIPVVAGGPRAISVSGASGSGQATFDVTPTLTVESPNASPGAEVRVSGSGFRANETGITIRFDEETVASGISADAQGRWTGSFTVPNATAGSHTVRASGSLTTASVPTASVIVGAGINLEQTSGPPGSVVRVTGSGVRARDRVVINVGNGLGNTEATANSQGEWSADLTIPPAPRGPLTINVAGSSGQGAEATFNITSTMTISEPKGSPNSPLIIRGAGFGANQSGITITFDDEVVTSVAADAQGSWNTTLGIPPTPKGTYFFRTSGTTPELQTPFTVIPGVSLTTPQAGPGESATVEGTGFAANESGITVTLGEAVVAPGIAANADGSWRANIDIPALPAGSYPITASGSETSAGSVNNQTLTLAPHITLSSTSGAPGASINVTGQGFNANQQGISITYDGATVVSGITADASGGFTTSFTVPPSSGGSHPVGVSGSTAGGGGSPDISFQVMPSIALTPPGGPPMGSLEITGSGFGANEQNIRVTYDNTTVLSGISADAQGSFQGSFDIPPSPAGPHVVQAAGATSDPSARPQQRYTVTPGIRLSEPTGNVGMPVEAIGRGFAPSSTITLSYDDLTETEVTADASGSFVLEEFIIPRSRQGEHQVRAQDNSGNSVQTTFAVEDTPPEVPELRTPEDGGRGGLFGGFRPDAQWTPVEDPSGVTYNLQIATDPNFTNIILEKKGLRGPSYTLGEEEALERGQYYWRAQAVDGASNPGPYSPAFEVNSGIIPLWVIPAAIVLGLLASGGGAYAYYAYVYRPRKLAQEAPLFPDFVRITKPEMPPPAQTLPTRPTPAPALTAPRRALPSPFRRGGRGLSPEDQARLQMVLDFVRSIPLLEVSPDLTWMEELVESLGSTTDRIYEQVLQGELEPVYQPAWTQHPTYMELQSVVHAQPFLQGLEGYIEAVNDCASDTLSLLRRIYRDVMAAEPMETRGQNQWRFVLTVGQSTIAWFRGTYLGQPSTRDYSIKSDADSDEEEPLASLYGEETAPCKGLIIEGMNKEDLAFYRDQHIQLRNIYRTNEEGRTLAAKMTSTNTMREQLMQSISQLADQDQKR
jgi:hypothetical protein